MPFSDNTLFWNKSAMELDAERFHILFELTDEMVYACSVAPNGSLVCEWATPALERITGYAPSTLATPGSVFLLVHASDLTAAHQQLQCVLQGQADTRDLRIVTKSGEIRWIRQQMHPIWNEHAKRVVRVYVVGRDITDTKCYETAMQRAQGELEERIAERTASLLATNAALAQEITERKRAEAAIRQLNGELEQLMQLKDQFLANMSHELRTPLGVILTLSESLMDHLYGQVTAQQKEMLGRIHQHGHHLLSLINDILDIAKIESGVLELEMSQVDVREVCQYSLQMVHVAARQKRIALCSKLDFALQVITADELRLTQMLINLLTNAVKFTPEGGEVGLDVTCDAAQQVARFSVWDTGIGIAAADQARLFRPFVQLDGGLRRANEGAGLGLALVARLAELHDGRVALESAPGQGSRFTITLPWQQPSSDSLPPAMALPVESMPVTATGATLILLVEDHAHTSAALAFYLTNQHYRVVTTGNGTEALTLALQHRPDLILTDIQMSDMDGLALVHRLRQQTACVKIPIIALTAHAMSGDRERFLAAGFTDYLSKPVDLRHLKAMIAKYLQVTPV